MLFEISNGDITASTPPFSQYIINKLSSLEKLTKTITINHLFHLVKLTDFFIWYASMFYRSTTGLGTTVTIINSQVYHLQLLSTH